MPTEAATPPPPDVGLYAVTEADIQRTLRGNVIGKGGKRLGRRQLHAGVVEELARLEAQAGRLRAWMRRQEERTGL